MKLRLWLGVCALTLLAPACGDDSGGDTGMDTDTGEPGDGDPGDGDPGDGDPGDGDPGDGDPGDGDPGDGDPGDGDGDPAIAEFTAVHQILMDQGCTAGYCHGADQGGLTMTDAATAYMNLVDVDATTPVCGLQKRVVPGEPDQSIMWMRARPLAMDMGMPCADKMPQGSEGLGDADAQILYDWIAGGALP